MGPAHADVPRNQLVTLSYTVTVQGGYVHTYTIHPDPCGPTFSGTGQFPAAPNAPQFNETLSGVEDGSGGLTYTDTYFDPATNMPTGYTYTFTGTFIDAQGVIAGTISDSNGNHGLTATGVPTGSTSTNFRSHGDYVNSLPPSQRSAAAQSCIGMPVQSHS